MYKLETWNERNTILMHDLDDISKELFAEARKYSYEGGLTLSYVPDDEDGNINEDLQVTVAEVHLRFFDNEAILNDGMDAVDIADMYNYDAETGMSAMLHSSLVCEVGDDSICINKALSPTVDIYIDKLYVYPEFRNAGIASMLMNSFRNIIKSNFNVEPRYVFLVPCPQTRVTGGWKRTDDPNGEMLELMTKFIAGKGFKRLGKSEFYGKNFLFDPIDEN